MVGSGRHTCSWDMKTSTEPSGEKRGSMADCRAGSKVSCTRGAAASASSEPSLVPAAAVGEEQRTKPQVRLKQ